MFSGRSAGGFLNQDAMADVLAKLSPGFTVHGFRSTFRDWAAGTEPALGNHVVEMALARADLVERRRGRLPPRRLVRKAGTADGGMGGVLRQRTGERRRGVVPMRGPGMKNKFAGPLAEPIYREDWYNRSWLDFSEGGRTEVAGNMAKPRTVGCGLTGSNSRRGKADCGCEGREVGLTCKRSRGA